jgi:hypothetical protein
MMMLKYVLAIVLLVVASVADAQQAGKKAKPRDTATVWVNKPAEGSLPAGVSHQVYRSQSMDHDVGYCIYLPPGYDQDNESR